MLSARISAAKTVAANGLIPFDTVIANTNDGTALVDNAVQIKKAGYYLAEINAVLSSTDAVTAGIQLYAQGKAVEGAIETVKVAANGTASVSFVYPVHVVAAESGIATLTYVSNAAVTANSAIVTVRKVP